MQQQQQLDELSPQQDNREEGNEEQAEPDSETKEPNGRQIDVEDIHEIEAPLLSPAHRGVVPSSVRLFKFDCTSVKH
ncbi:hypothetical protein PRIPAC_85895 [Pristionchus pacificus]|nr:hypothetical protein PRIPAC_85895 [Pristionchus pacificus]|eukprot:PDM67546.1 hypothetical protein PRIPAC_48963 [Pristionchus pacificus]